MSERESYPVWNTYDFVRESNRIENIHTEPTAAEELEHDRFMGLSRLRVEDFTQFVSVYQPNARLRTKHGDDVRIGDYFPPRGGMGIVYKLKDICDRANEIPKLLRPEQAWELHVEYEKLHPFTDGNGRSGRALWYWMMQTNGSTKYLGFLRQFYYQTLHRQSK